MYEQAKKLIKERILGTRKGSNSLNYLHSMRVSESLKKHGFSDELVLAGILHDIVEDGNTELQELKDLGYPSRVVELVDLCSHDSLIKDKYQRRAKMMQRILDKNDQDAFSIKLADYNDNLSECHTMPNKEKLDNFLKIKGPFFCYHGYKYLGENTLYKEFIERYWFKVNEIHPYFQ